jgi:hypothetical protein
MKKSVLTSMVGLTVKRAQGIARANEYETEVYPIGTIISAEARDSIILWTMKDNDNIVQEATVGDPLDLED